MLQLVISGAGFALLALPRSQLGHVLLPDALLALLTHIGTEVAVPVVLAVAAVCGAALVVIWHARRRWPALWAEAMPPGFGMRRPVGHWLLLSGSIGLLAPVLGGLLTQVLAQGHAISQNVEQLARSAPPVGRAALALIAITVAPLTEELLFRGVLLSALAPRWGVRTAAAASAVAFTVLHVPGLQWQWFALPQLLLLGIVLAWLRLHCRSLWPAVLAHATHNALALSVWFAAFSLTS